MPGIDLENLDLAADIMHDATNLAVAARRQLPPDAVVFKSDGSIVTAVDVALQVFILTELERVFGSILAIAEEDERSIGGHAAAEAHCRALLHDWGFDGGEAMLARALNSGGYAGSTRGQGDVWVLDPIDGTQGFVDGDHWCPCLALLRDGEPVFGCNGHPSILGGQLLSAVKGQGAWWYPLDAGDEGEPVAVTVRQDALAPNELIRVVAPARPTPAQREARLHIGESTGHPCSLVFADSQAKYATVLAGHGDVAFSRRGRGPGKYIWDHAGAILIAQEAGAWVGDTDLRAIDCSRGRRLDGNSAVICAARAVGPSIAAALRARDEAEGIAAEGITHSVPRAHEERNDG